MMGSPVGDGDGVGIPPVGEDVGVAMAVRALLSLLLTVTYLQICPACTSWPLVMEKVKGHDDAMNDGSSLEVSCSPRSLLQRSPTRGAELMLPPAPASREIETSTGRGFLKSASRLCKSDAVVQRRLPGGVQWWYTEKLCIETIALVSTNENGRIQGAHGEESKRRLRRSEGAGNGRYARYRCWVSMRTGLKGRASCRSLTDGWSSKPCSVLQSIALRYALAGASVWIVGRNEQKANSVLEQLRLASAEAHRRKQPAGAVAVDSKQDRGTAEHDFFQADLSKVEDIERVAGEIQKKAGSDGIDWLIETQGESREGLTGRADLSKLTLNTS